MSKSWVGPWIRLAGATVGSNGAPSSANSTMTPSASAHTVMLARLAWPCVTALRNTSSRQKPNGEFSLFTESHVARLTGDQVLSLRGGLDGGGKVARAERRPKLAPAF